MCRFLRYISKFRDKTKLAIKIRVLRGSSGKLGTFVFLQQPHFNAFIKRNPGNPGQQKQPTERITHHDIIGEVEKIKGSFQPYKIFLKVGFPFSLKEE